MINSSQAVEQENSRVVEQGVVEQESIRILISVFVSIFRPDAY
jgi:hypothetical protein